MNKVSLDKDSADIWNILSKLTTLQSQGNCKLIFGNACYKWDQVPPPPTLEHRTAGGNYVVPHSVTIKVLHYRRVCTIYHAHWKISFP